MIIKIASSYLRIFFSQSIEAYRYLVSPFARLCAEADNVVAVHFDRGTRF